MKKFAQLLFAALISLAIALPAFAADTAKAPVPAQAAPVEKKQAAPAAKEELIDINTATEAQLKTLTGISDVYAKKIIAGRPYARKDQLVMKEILPKATYEKIKDKIIAKQVKK
jgi:competence protein ComEA